MAQAREILCDVHYADNAYDCAQGADVLVLVTEWEQFRALDFTILKTVMSKPVIVDLRNVYLPDEVARHGFAYTGVGVKTPVPNTDSNPDKGGREKFELFPEASCEKNWAS
jgi:UDPglucose 6-dehydrogenase